MSRNKKNMILAPLLGVVFAAIGIPCIFHAYTERETGKKSESWPTVNGQVTQSEIGYTTGNDRTNYPKITYAYSVDGKPYESQRVRFAAIGGRDAGETNSVLNKFPVGSTPAVYYDPEDPAQSVLEPGACGRSWGLLAAGIAFFGFGTICIGFGIREFWRV
jgi:hypothetical protein